MKPSAPHDIHLDEPMRQALADGTITGPARDDALKHLAACPHCAADVALLTSTIARMRDQSTISVPADLESLWTDVRARVESKKVIHLAADAPTGRRGRRHLSTALWSAAALVFMAALVAGSRIAWRHLTAGTLAEAAVADSLDAYDAEARALLDHLEVERAVMRRETAATIDHDLAAIDSAIEELQLALSKDPRNPALRQLLASSYRQKVSLLRRARNAS